MANQNSSRTGFRTLPASAAVPKLCGADVEVGNVVRGMNGPQNTARLASQLLLRQIPGIPHSRWSDSGGNSGDSNYCYSYTTGGAAWCPDGEKTPDAWPSNFSQYASQDWGRRYLASNGGCVYIDLNHLELCIPEVLSALDFVAAWHAMLLVARQAMQRVNAQVRHGRIQVLVNNSDGHGNSYGSHLNFLLSRRAWENLFHRKAHQMAYLASYQASSIVFTGQGKVGAENDAPDVAYQISQRADHFERLSGTQTTFDRPMVNSRDESLCGTRSYQRHDRGTQSDLARLHCIFYDSNLCHVACLLKVGVLQIILAMIEAGHVAPALILDDPLEAVGRFSHDPSLRARARMASGRKLTAVELQLLFLEEAQTFCAAGACDQVVPHAGEILAIYADTLEKLRAGDWDALAPRLDWVLKRRILEQTMAGRPSLTWDSPQIKLLDHLYSSLDPEEGLYWIYEKAGFTERVASPTQIERFLHQPPEDTRAYSRAMLLRLAGREQIDTVDWDSIGFRLPGRSEWPVYRTLEMADPLAFTKADTGVWLESGEPLEVVLGALIDRKSDRRVSDEAESPPENRPSPAWSAPSEPAARSSDGSLATNSELVVQSRQKSQESGGQNDAVA